MDTKKEQITIAIGGALLGMIAVALSYFGNPANMGFCIACFIRDSAGALGLHRAAAVEYLRPEIIGVVLGAFLISIGRKEFSAKGGSSPLTRFIMGFFVMIGCLMFLGCPFRMLLRLAGGDFNALFGLAGFACGIGCGVFFLTRGYSLKRTYRQSTSEGIIFPVLQVVFLILLVGFPALLLFTEAGGGPGALHAPIILSLVFGIAAGIIGQVTRLCMAGGIRDLILFKDSRLIIGFVCILVAALIGNIVLGFFHPGFANQPIAHTDGLWNFLGMVLAGLGSSLLGGCPFRQLILAGEGNTDSAVTWLGLLTGAAFAHNFGLAGAAAKAATETEAAVAGGPATAGKAAVIACIIVLFIIAVTNKRNLKRGK